MLFNGLMSLASAIILAVSISKIRHRLPVNLERSDKILIKLCWLVIARLLIVSLYHIPIGLDYLRPTHYYFKYLLDAYKYTDLLTSIVGLVFSYFLYVKYYANEKSV